MKITKVEAIPCAIPYNKALRFASGEVHVAEHVLVDRIAALADERHGAKVPYGAGPARFAGCSPVSAPCYPS